MWPFSTKKKSSAPSEATCDGDARDDAVDAAHAVRRRAAEQRVIDDLRAAEAAQTATMTMEAVHVVDVDRRRREADTAARKARKHASEVSSIGAGPNGKRPPAATEDGPRHAEVAG